MTANIVVFLRVQSQPRDEKRPGRLFVSRYGFTEFCAGGSYPFENPRKNKPREKRPAPVAGLIVAACEESRKTAEKGPDLKDLGHFLTRH
jgi:hypothetical protein